MEAFYPRTRQKYAIKVIDKEPLIRKNLVRVAGIEKNALLRLSMGGHPGVIRLHWAFQDQWSVCKLLVHAKSSLKITPYLDLVLDLVGQGCLLSRINQLGSICLSATKWYVAQIIDTVVWMHVKGVVHRDLKPENVLIGDDMRIKISDYGSAKLFDTEKDGEDRLFHTSKEKLKDLRILGLADDRSNSWVCTPQYVPPELLIGGIMSRRYIYSMPLMYILSLTTSHQFRLLGHRLYPLPNALRDLSVPRRIQLSNVGESPNIGI